MFIAILFISIFESSACYNFVYNLLYSDRTVDNDIALIRVAPLGLTSLPDSIRPVCLPEYTDYSGQDAMVAGWGTLSSGE